MNTEELQKLAQRTRSTKEMGIALLAASGILALFLLVPKAEPSAAETNVTVATSTAPDAFASVPLTAQAAIVYDLATNKPLYEKNADAQLPLASLTKLLTVYAALSNLSPDATISIPEDATQLDSPRAFTTGESFALSDLARLTLTASLNDGAAAIAEATAQAVQKPQPDMLAAAAASLQLAQTYAVNGSGLDVTTALSGGYGSARDLARLAGSLVKKAPEITYATTEATAEATSLGGRTLEVKNTDPMINTIPGLLLSKTGYTDLAGGNLALVFDVGLEHPVAVVILGSSQKDRFTDGMALVAATLAHFSGVQSL